MVAGVSSNRRVDGKAELNVFGTVPPPVRQRFRFLHLIEEETKKLHGKGAFVSNSYHLHLTTGSLIIINIVKMNIHI